MKTKNIIWKEKDETYEVITFNKYTPFLKMSYWGADCWRTIFISDAKEIPLLNTWQSSHGIVTSRREGNISSNTWTNLVYAKSLKIFAGLYENVSHHCTQIPDSIPLPSLSETL